MYSDKLLQPTLRNANVTNSQTRRYETLRMTAGFALGLIAPIVFSLSSAAAPYNNKPTAPAAVEQRCLQLVGGERMEEAQHLLIPWCKRPTATGTMHALLAKTYMDDPYESSRLSAQVKIELATALKLDPESGTVYRVLAEYANLQGDHKKAIQYARKAIDCKKPDKDSGYRQLVIAYSSLKDYPQAYKCNEERFKYSGMNDSNLRNRAMLLEQMGKQTEAVQAWREALKFRRDDSTQLSLIACLEHGGQDKEAIEELSSLIKNNPADDEARSRRAKLYVKIKQYKEAISDYSAAIKEAPSARLYKARAEIYKLMGQPAAAAADLEQAKKEEKKAY